MTASNVILQSTLQAGGLAVESLDHLRGQPEDLFFDFKSGKLASSPNGPRAVREHVSAFANSEGGMLIIGIEDRPPRKLDAVKPQGGKSPVDWARDCVQPLAPHLRPAPRISITKHSDGDVLVIAVARASALVPVVLDGRPRYFIRIGGGSHEAPDYLLSDLVLGRRAHASFAVTIDRAVIRPGHTIPLATHYSVVQQALRIDLTLRIENDSLVACDRAIGGIVHWVLSTEKIAPVNRNLQRYLEVVEPEVRGWQFLSDSEPQSLAGLAQWQLTQSSIDHKEFALQPFQSRAIELPSIDIPVAPRACEQEMALFLLPLGSPPELYGLRVPLSWDMIGHGDFETSDIAIERKHGEAPRITWNLSR